MKIRLSKLVLLIIGMLLLVGCHKLEATTSIKSNGSGELRMEVGFSAEEKANLEKQNPNQQDFCTVSQAPENVTVIEEQRGDETWCVSITAFNNLDELRSLYQQRKGVAINRLEINDGRFYYDIDVDMSSEDSGFSVLKEMRWSVVIPGALVSHNADQVDGNILTWQPAPKSGIVNLTAQSNVPDAFNFPPCGAAYIALGMGLIFFRKKDL